MNSENFYYERKNNVFVQNKIIRIIFIFLIIHSGISFDQRVYHMPAYKRDN